MNKTFETITTISFLLCAFAGMLLIGVVSVSAGPVYAWVFCGMGVVTIISSVAGAIYEKGQRDTYDKMCKLTGEGDDS